MQKAAIEYQAHITKIGKDVLSFYTDRETAAMAKLHDKYGFSYRNIGDVFAFTKQAVHHRVKEYRNKTPQE
ncbi:hypothetical protein IJJ08_01825 [bacterium]|nr:hypothetical protein [bacterium]